MLVFTRDKKLQKAVVSILQAGKVKKRKCHCSEPGSPPPAQTLLVGALPTPWLLVQLFLLQLIRNMDPDPTLPVYTPEAHTDAVGAITALKK